MTIFRFSLLFGGLVACFAGGSAFANFLVQLPTEELTRRSDLIVIATPVACPPFVAGQPNPPCEFRVIKTLKGTDPRILRLERETSIAEEALAGCCEVNRPYKLYLTQGGHRWFSVHGHWGVVDLDEGDLVNQTKDAIQ